MKIRKTIVLLLLSIIAAVCFCSCGKTEQAQVSQSEGSEDEGITIGMSFDSFLIERWQRDRDVFVDQCQKDRAS